MALPIHSGADTASLEPNQFVIVVVSFEGPDPYAQAGGLGVRVTGLVETTACLDYETHLFFIGDPNLPGEEVAFDGRLFLHRWAQWISANCPAGVYDGELGKVADLTASLPAFLVDRVLSPAIQAGRTPIVVFEEWQTAECACRVSDLLCVLGMRGRAVLSWNANNSYGFDRIDWPRLAAATTITTISRYMRSIIRACGVDARVIPNGLPAHELEPVPRGDINELRAAVRARGDVGLLFKMARWEREKGWMQALDAIRATRENPLPRRPILVARSGGPTGVGAGLVREAGERGLRVVSFDTESRFRNGLSEAAGSDVDVIALRFGVSHGLARVLYAAAEGVLANSISEPFGLVGLEAMAAGGVTFTGGTGEDYAVGGRNAIVLETVEPGEIVMHWNELATSPELGPRIRKAARRTARDYAWSVVIERMIASLMHAPAYERRRPTQADVGLAGAEFSAAAATRTSHAKWIACGPEAVPEFS